MPAKKTTAKKAICGHVNKHSKHWDGTFSDLECVLPAGHDGDHECDYQSLKPVEEIPLLPGNAQVQLVHGVAHAVIVERAFWSDAAGTRPHPEKITQEKDALRFASAKEVEMYEESVGSAKQVEERLQKKAAEEAEAIANLPKE